MNDNDLKLHRHIHAQVVENSKRALNDQELKNYKKEFLTWWEK